MNLDTSKHLSGWDEMYSGGDEMEKSKYWQPWVLSQGHEFHPESQRGASEEF